MNRLVRVELRRLRARRLVLMAVLAALLGAALVVVGSAESARPMTDSERAQAEEAWQWAQQDWEENGEEWTADCLESEEAEREATGEDVDFGCEDMAPQREWYFPADPTFESYFPMLAFSATYLVLLLGFAIGATFTAAEFSTGAIGNWLTFEPRRGRVYAAKLLGTAIGAVPVVLAVLAVAIGGSWVTFEVLGSGAAVTVEHVWTSARLWVLGVLFAVLGAALGVLLRHTGAVLGLVIAYAVVVEGVLGGLLPMLQRWQLRLNLDAWVHYGTSYQVIDCTVSETGTMCEAVDHALPFAHGAIYLAVLAIAVVALGAFVFRRRDVA